jgi:hypothetical protein
VILRTYARVFTDTPEATVTLLEELVGRPADLRFSFGPLDLAAVGDFLVLGGPKEALAPFREGVGPVIVDDLEATIDGLTTKGAAVEQQPAPSQTGTFAYLRHPDGVLVEYVQWLPELRERILGR